MRSLYPTSLQISGRPVKVDFFKKSFGVLVLFLECCLHFSVHIALAIMNFRLSLASCSTAKSALQYVAVWYQQRKAAGNRAHHSRSRRNLESILEVTLYMTESKLQLNLCSLLYFSTVRDSCIQSYSSIGQQIWEKLKRLNYIWTKTTDHIHSLIVT